MLLTLAPGSYRNKKPSGATFAPFPTVIATYADPGTLASGLIHTSTPSPDPAAPCGARPQGLEAFTCSHRATALPDEGSPMPMMDTRVPPSRRPNDGDMTACKD
eukprot:123377-Hanusia_phi.AAC.1